ncbi:MAG: hypothetical protein WB947_00560 [Thermoplasmata archaeon]
MKPEYVRAVVDLLEESGFEVLVVGGVVMERRRLAATADVDVLVTVSNFRDLPEKM